MNQEFIMTKAPPTASVDVEQLAHAYGPLVLSTAHRILGDASAAQDIQQDVFVQLLEKTPPQVESWPAWLKTTTTRKAIDRLRKTQRRARLQSYIPEPFRSAPPEEVRTGNELVEALRKASTSLSRREAQVFFLSAFSELAPTEVARELTISENNVHVVLHRARQRLHDLLTRAGNLEQSEKSS